MSGLFDLAGTRALITGGNSGLGLAYARGLARQGADVIIWGRDPQKNSDAVRALGQFGTGVHSQIVDVTDEEAVIKGFTEATATFGRVNCVVQNAGFNNPAASILELTTAMWNAQIDVALNGGFYTLREAARHMVASAEAGFRDNCMILCGSGILSAGVSGLEHYAAAKAGLAAMMRCMVAGLSRHGIRVNMISPGLFRTELDMADGAGFEAVAQQTPLGRVGETEDLEAAVAYLASPGARHHTGDTLVIDGGWLATYM